MSAPAELYAESALYALLFRERTADVAFYRALAAEHGGPILELGCGDGRVALALARDGHRVVGVDRARAMLDALEAQRGALALATHEADMRDVRLGERFGLVIAPFNAFAHLHAHEDRARFFATVEAHLAPGGVFAFDVTIPDPAHRAGSTSFVPRVVHPRTGRVCRLEERTAFDPSTEVRTIETRLVERESGEVQVLSLALREWDPAATARMLEGFGLVVERRSADIGDSLAYVCRLR
ncbi:MAG: class I SAM-dependent methyltransferase [Sandaracinaceae bacterium]|nr:class I SAM-dependent methyltransferase [Sandaracinaceae bacterium]